MLLNYLNRILNFLSNNTEKPLSQWFFWTVPNHKILWSLYNSKMNTISLVGSRNTFGHLEKEHSFEIGHINKLSNGFSALFS